MKGYIDCWKHSYGFAYSSESVRIKYFIHITSVQGGVPPQAGNLIEFDPGMTLKGPVGLNVRVLGRDETIAAMSSLGGTK